jgi:hypothetical protein
VGVTVRLEFLNAAHGDAILASWGDSPRLALIDGGPSGSFGVALGPRLEELKAERTQAEDEALVLDLVYVSHIDDDHIAGIVQLLTNLRRKQRDGLPLPYRVERLWHNSFEEVIAAADPGASVAQVESELGQMGRTAQVVAASVNQGRDVRDLGRALGVAGNVPFGGVITGGMSADVYGLNFTIVAPNQGALDALEAEWRKAKRRKEPEVLAQAFSDTHVPNLSSICSVVGGPKGGALLTADARGDRVMEGLEAAALMPVGGTVHFQVFQVPHHGSKNNSDQVLYERVTADHYVISADGLAHPHPSPDTLAWIANARGTDGYTIHLTNSIPAAMTQLKELAVRRNFTVEARTDPQRGIAVPFETASV